MNNFDIYKASAGSGKTYNLVLKYMCLLFKEGYYNDYHKRILAVTFTNKATEEMKRRIIESLYQMYAVGGGYVETIQKIYPDIYKTEDDVRKMSYFILRSVLSRYTNFNVRTIDSFFQQVLRSFAREISFYSNFRVEIDKDMVIEGAVDDIINDLHEQMPLFEYIEKFALMKVKDGASYNIKRSLLDMVLKLYDDAFVKLSDQLPKVSDFKSFVKDFESQEENVLDSLKTTCDEIIDAMSSCGLEPCDFKQGAKSFAFYYNYNKLKASKFSPSATFLKTLLSDDVSDFATKSNPKNIDQFVSMTTELRSRLSCLMTEYHTVAVVKKNLYIVVILNDLKQKVLDKSKENNLLLISSSAEFINNIIQNAEAPFIYEKTGVFIDNYMIDEFQDTSIMQWENFMPLLKESVACGNWNMVVGDVKQSIYRWREGDWSILNSRVEETFANNNIVRLKDNYRSYNNVVRVNNELLTEVVSLSKKYLENEAYIGLNEVAKEERWAEFKNIYGDLKQTPKSKFDGSYHLSFIKHGLEGIEWKKVALNNMLKEMMFLHDEKGFSYSDITVLVRENKEAAEVAQFLVENNIPVISNEAMSVDSSLVVQFVLSFLKYLSNSKNEQYRMDLLFYYAQISENVAGIITDIDKYIKHSDFKEEQWEEEVFGLEVAKQLQSIKRDSIYEFVTSLVAIFNLSGVDTQYVQAFFDIIFDMESQGNCELRVFLDYWAKKGEKKKISMAKEHEAVSIFTIHKSKGMEYDIIFIPFCDWELGPNKKNSNYVWVDSKGFSLAQHLPIVPLDLGKGYSTVLKTNFADRARVEYEKCCIDQINVAYVAFTRAVKHIYVYSKLPFDKKKQTVKEEYSFSYLMYSALESGLDELHFETKIRDDSYEYVIGNVDDNVAEIVEEQRNVVSLDLQYKRRIDIEKHLKLKPNDDFGVIADENALYGKLMHGIFESIRYSEELEAEIEKMKLSGLVSLEDCEKVHEMMLRFMNFSDETRSWFGKSYEIMNELEILMHDGNVYRPDRVMIDKKTRSVVVVDYKFGVERKKYVNQVKGYMKILNDMGYTNVAGKICYIGDEVKIASL